MPTNEHEIGCEFPGTAIRSTVLAACAPVIWFTGLSGAGKSTIARTLAVALKSAGHAVEHVDGDQIRTMFPQIGFTRDARNLHVRWVGYLASVLANHGVVSVCALISPYAAVRNEIRASCCHFVEVHVATPLEECERRDVKGLYARARQGMLPHFTGIDDPYEAPSAPELSIDTRFVTIDQSVATILRYLRSHGMLAL